MPTSWCPDGLCVYTAGLRSGGAGMVAEALPSCLVQKYSLLCIRVAALAAQWGLAAALAVLARAVHPV